MRIIRLFALAFLFIGLFRVAQEPVFAVGACEDACTYQYNVCLGDAQQDYDWCYSTAETNFMGCEAEAWWRYSDCMNAAGGHAALEMVCETNLDNEDAWCWDRFTADQAPCESQRAGAETACDEANTNCVAGCP